MSSDGESSGGESSGDIPPKVAIVTGAAQGIGEAVVLRLAGDGFDVILNDIDSQSGRGTKAAKAISLKTGRTVIFQAGDVSKEQDVEYLVQMAVEKLGGLDVMVANAGVCTTNSITETTPEQWNRHMNVNALGVLFCYRSAARVMIKQGRGGRLIGASTVCAIKGNHMVAAYSASKFAMRALTQCAAAEWAKYRITANCYSAGAVNTRMHHDCAEEMSVKMRIPIEELLKGTYGSIPLGYVSTPKDVAGLVAFLASSDSHYITGQSIGIDGGWQMS
jgi:acetoin reductase-like protein